MIRYTLICDASHRFDSWFRSADAYQALADAGQLSCTTCGSPRIAKAVMAPAVAATGALSAPDVAPLERLRARIEAESEDVGGNFAVEARAIHAGDAPARLIRGEATGAEVRDLLADEIPVMPMPPKRRTH
ncbi:hypothetical protein SAMN04488003_11415 [Loktanella fryxellensis]|uniref:DUF1178 family protein n=1 Tax=Loktanella fryxellensis TaxID=245187 RepID=A0A1H8FW49_9RHOB|nr:DUF1178 family protein [Loktanella fryxellensis]SEN36051.1 hypothetical protein SAMN04488003_11415 [Loktanella fryxellensis]